MTIKELSGVDGANAQLAHLHVPVRVARVEAGCSAPGKTVPIPPTIVSDLVHYEGQTVSIRPGLVPHGDVLVISAKQIGSSVGVSYGLFRTTAPSCVGQGDSNVG